MAPMDAIRLFFSVDIASTRRFMATHLPLPIEVLVVMAMPVTEMVGNSRYRSTDFIHVITDCTIFVIISD